MRFTSFFILLFSCLFLISCSLKDKWVKKKIEKEESSKRAYILGYNIGNNAKKFLKKEEDQKIFLIGVYDSVKGKKPLLSLSKKGQKAGLPSDVSEKEIKERNKGNMEQGKEFLKKNKEKADVKTTASGLQYKVLKEGSGKSPSADSKVEVHYRGTFIDGQEFDSSYKRNESITFPLNGVIKGWTEGLQLMKEGAKYEFYIPSELAYGPSGNQGIPPHSVLIFQVELIKVQ